MMRSGEKAYETSRGFTESDQVRQDLAKLAYIGDFTSPREVSRVVTSATVARPHQTCGEVSRNVIDETSLNPFIVANTVYFELKRVVLSSCAIRHPPRYAHRRSRWKKVQDARKVLRSLERCSRSIHVWMSLAKSCEM